MPKINPSIDFPTNENRVKPRMGVDPATIEVMDNETPHHSEFLDGRWMLDEWVCNHERIITIHVASPEPLPHDQALALCRKLGDPLDSLKLGRQKQRVYHFEPGVPVKIPTSHRMAVQQVRDGYVVGGLLPSARLVGTEALPIHPALIPAQGPNVPKVEQRADDGSPLIAAGMFEAGDDSPERRALARARARRGA